MAARELSKIVDQLRSVLAKHDASELTDGDLLERYFRARDEGAFEALVRRHGPMVMGVCRRVLANPHDAEDAFQATFLILVRKGATLRSPGLVGHWLYGVAYRTALEARKTALKRRAKEAALVPRVQTPEDRWADLWPELDREPRLPAKYRLVLVLCDMEGQTRKEAARHLGWAEGTVASRLASARSALAKRLARYRLAVSGAAVVELLTANASACVPTLMVCSTSQAASLLAAGPVAANAAISAEVASLTKGVLNIMWLTKFKAATVVVLFMCLLGAGVIAGIRTQIQAAEPAQAQPRSGQKNGAEGPLRATAGGAANPAARAAEQPKEDAKWTSLERRLGNLQKQIERLTGEVQALRKETQPRTARPARKAPIKIYSLKYAKASEVAKTLQELFRDQPSATGPKSGTTLRIATHASTNSILMQGAPEETEMVEAIINRLDQQSQDKK